jgi:hypothetical protein
MGKQKLPWVWITRNVDMEPFPTAGLTGTKDEQITLKRQTFIRLYVKMSLYIIS